MNKRKLIPLIALGAVVVMLALLLVMLQRTAAEETTEDSGIALCSMDTDAVDKIAYTTDTMDITLSKDADGSWILDSDPLLPLDQSAVSTIAADISGMTAVRELGAEADTAAMGLDAPQMQLMLWAGDESYTLTVGDKNTMTDSYYARTSEGESVYTVATTDLASLCKADTALYAKQDITDIESDAIAEMTVDNGDAVLSFVQTDGTWALADDTDYAIDQDLVSRMASTICDLQSSWSITTPDVLSTYGLDAPNVTVTLKTSDGTKVQCSFGGTDPADNTKCYLVSSDAPEVVYEVAADNISAFAYTKATLQAATAETAETAGSDTANIVAEYPVGGADDYAN